MEILVFDIIYSQIAQQLSKDLDIKICINLQPPYEKLYIIFGAVFQAHQLYSLQLQAMGNAQTGGQSLQHNIKYIIYNHVLKGSEYLLNKYYINLLKNNYVIGSDCETSKYLYDTFNIKTISHISEATHNKWAICKIKNLIL